METEERPKGATGNKPSVKAGKGVSTEGKEANGSRGKAPKVEDAKAPASGEGGKRPAGQRGGRGAAPAPVQAAVAAEGKATVVPTPRLLERYRREAVPLMVREFSYRSIMEVPRLEKVTLNIGLAEALQNAKAVENAQRDLVLIAGQKPVETKAKKAVAAFKLRQGQVIGLRVTLRGKRMWWFLDKLMSVALPRIRDFRGVPRTSFNTGTYSLGLREQVVFPEIEYSQIDKLRGLQVNVVTTARSAKEAERLLEVLGMPFERAVV
ncbi:MAG: 50S ribosomal protein L5 [Chloroflexi bacterium]|nr:50S ribosomal protein L5 [Chloroflexota bacterium]